MNFHLAGLVSHACFSNTALFQFFQCKSCENQAWESEFEEARKGSLTVSVHADMRAHAFLTITTNSCWEACEKEGSSCWGGIKNAMSFLYFRGREKWGIAVLFALDFLQQMQICAIWSRLVHKIHFGLICLLAVCILSLERLPSVQQQGTDVNELPGQHEELCKKWLCRVQSE